MNLKNAPIMAALLLSFSISNIHISIAETVENSETTIIDSAEIATTQENAEISDNTDVIINDPVATYNGIPISKEEFLDYMEGVTGIRTDEFESIDSLKSYLFAYYLYELLAQKAEDMGLNQSPEAVEKYEILTTLLLAQEVNQQAPSFSLDNVMQDAEKITDTKLSDEGLYFFATLIGLDVNEDLIQEDDSLRNYLYTVFNNAIVLTQIAKDQGLDNSEPFKSKLLQERKAFLSELYTDHYLQGFPVVEDEVERVYQQWLDTQDFNYYKVSHIVLSDKNKADLIYSDIEQGKIGFKEAAIKYSEDEASKDYSGALSRGDWVQFWDKRNPLGAALRSLKPGEMSKAIQGPSNKYHILFLDDLKDAEILPMFQTKNFKESLWKQQILEDYYAQLHLLFDSEIVIN